MKKLLSIILSLSLVLGLTISMSAASIPLGSTDFEPILTSEGKTVTKIVRTKTHEYSVTGIYHESDSKKELAYVNKARKAAGIHELKWNAGLEDAAIQRALEQYVSFSHTRPDGSKWYTVDENANGENLAKGINIYLDAKMVTEQWLNSPGHYNNIMNTSFVSMTAACVETDQGIIWVQLFSVKESVKETESSQNNVEGKHADSNKGLLLTWRTSMPEDENAMNPGRNKNR